MEVRLHDAPLWLSALLLVGLAAGATFALAHLAHRRYPHEVLKGNNEVAGFKFGVIGAVYGLLVALALVAVWESFDRSRENAAQEYACVRGLRRIADGLSPAGASAMGAALDRYVQETDQAWGDADADRPATGTVDDMGRVLAGEREAAAAPFVSTALDRLDRLAELRAARHEGERNGMPEFLWAVLVVGALVTVGFTLFFGSPNRRSQRAMAAILAGTLALVLFAVVELDHAYSGVVRVESPFAGGRSM